MVFTRDFDLGAASLLRWLEVGGRVFEKDLKEL